MAYFVYRLIPPRPTFDEDMNDFEQMRMARHVAYWHGLVARGRAIVFGPVRDPTGVWGLAVVDAVSASEVHDLGAADPAVTSGVARFDVFEMPGAIAAELQAPAATSA